MVNRRLPRFLLIAIGVAAAGACTAPVDLSAVQKYASTTAAAGASFSALAADFQASCARYNDAHDYVVNAASSPTLPILVGDPSTAQLTDAVSIAALVLQPGYQFVPVASSSSVPTPSPNVPAPIPTAMSNAATCENAADVSKAWGQANSTVLAYVQSLGNLANVDAVPTINPSPLASPLAKIGVSSSAIQASSAILGSIAKFYTLQTSERDISRFLAEVNPSMPGATEALRYVDAVYSIELADEFIEIETQYGGFARTELRNYDTIKGSSQGSINRRLAIAQRLLSTKAAVLSALTFINNQRQASAAYGSAIDQILKTHEQLYEASQRRATLSDYLNVIQTTGAPVLTDLDTLAKAVKK